MKFNCMSSCLRCFTIGEHILEECKDKPFVPSFPIFFHSNGFHDIGDQSRSAFSYWKINHIENQLNRAYLKAVQRQMSPALSRQPYSGTQWGTRGWLLL